MFSTAGYRATSVTLPDHTVAYNLGDLLIAVDAAFPRTGREVTLSIGSSTLRIGDPTVSTTICGIIVTPTLPHTYRSNISDIPMGMFWLLGTIDNLVVNVEVMQ